jgi:hypothetical protein
MAFKPDPAGSADPCPGDDAVAEEGRLHIVDLVTHHNPLKFRLVSGGRRSLPVRHRGLLHPAEVGDIVDMAHLVDISRLD